MIHVCKYSMDIRIIITHIQFMLLQTIVLHMDGSILFFPSFGFFSFRAMRELALPSIISRYKYLHSYFVKNSFSFLPSRLAAFETSSSLIWKNLKNHNSTSLVSQLAPLTWRSEKQTTKSILQLAFFFPIFSLFITFITKLIFTFFFSKFQAISYLFWKK